MQHIVGGVCEDRPKTPHEAFANAIDDLDVVVQQFAIADESALELIRLVRRELLDRERQFSVLLQRLDQTWA